MREYLEETGVQVQGTGGGGVVGCCVCVCGGVGVEWCAAAALFACQPELPPKEL
jgi:hypothetical protein